MSELTDKLRKGDIDGYYVTAKQAADRIDDLEKINTQLVETHNNQLMVYSRMNKENEDLRSALRDAIALIKDEQIDCGSKFAREQAREFEKVLYNA